MRPSTRALIRIEVISGELNSLYGTNIKNKNPPTESTLDGVVIFLLLL
jgi:hypothetical protein